MASSCFLTHLEWPICLGIRILALRRQSNSPPKKNSDMRRLQFIFLVMMLLLPLCMRAQGYTSLPFNGQILDIHRSPMKNVRVWVNNNQKASTVTNKRGQFGLLDVHEGDTLKLYYKKRLYNVEVGNKQAIRIHFWRDMSGVDIEEANELLEMGYGLIRKAINTSSENHIAREELIATGKTDLLDALQGRIPGLTIQPTMLNQESEARIGGITSLKGGNTPLYVVDGTITSSLTGYTVYQVDYVEILKDASIYGARGSNGAIIVKTLQQ